MTRPDHPFLAVHRMAQDEGSLDLRLFVAGPVVRLHTDAPPVVFRLETDPGSAADRQTFDYHSHVRLAPGDPPALLAAIWRHFARRPGGNPSGATE